LSFRTRASGIWVTPKHIHIRDSSGWRFADRVYVRQGGSWRLAGERAGYNYAIYNGADNTLNWSGICYGNGLFVAVSRTGNTSRIATSPDGVTWTFRTTPSLSHAWSSVAYSPTLGLFIAVCDTSETEKMTVMKSTDGISWTLQTISVPGFPYGISCRRIIWAGGRFVAMGYTYQSPNPGITLTSTDGNSWIISSNPYYNDQSYRGLAYGNGIYLMVGGGSNSRVVLTSTNGLTWTEKPVMYNGERVRFMTIAYGNNQFVLIGRGIMTYYSTILFYTTTDGQNFTLRHSYDYNSVGGAFAYVCLEYADGLFFAPPYGTSSTGVTLNHKVAVSKDGINWTFHNNPYTGTTQVRNVEVAYGAGRFVAVGGFHPIFNGNVGDAGRVFVSYPTW